MNEIIIYKEEDEYEYEEEEEEEDKGLINFSNKARGFGFGVPKEY